MCTNRTYAQTAEQVIATYLEKSGGTDKWNDLKATKMSAVVVVEGMEIPLEIYSTKTGKQAIMIEFAGEKITQFAFDGEILWTTDLISLEAEKGGAEVTENMKLNIKDFPNPFLNYKEKGYTAELTGKETVGRVTSYIVQLNQEPILINGEEQENISIYHFNSNTFLPVKIQTKIILNGVSSIINESLLENYKKVNGLYFPFTIIEGGQEIKILKVELNPKIDPGIFAFPGD